MKLVTGLTVAAVVAALALAPVLSVEAGPEKSPFEGTYAWNSQGVWDITISSGGQIKGSLTPSFPYTKGSLSGQVGDDGSYSFLVSLTSITFDFPDERHPTPGGPKTRTGHYKFMGTLGLVEGNIVGTPSIHQAFLWVRQ